MTSPPLLHLDFGDRAADALALAETLARRVPPGTVADLLDRFPARTLVPLDGSWRSLPLDQVTLQAVTLDGGDGGRPPAAPAAERPFELPPTLSDPEAVDRACRGEIDAIRRLLEQGLSVVVSCDKALVEHLHGPMVARAGREEVVLRRDLREDPGAGGLPAMPGRALDVDGLERALRDLKDAQVLVLPHLDLMVHAATGTLTSDGRAVIELLYRYGGATLLGFRDRSLPLPEVLLGRFAVRAEVAGLPREVDLDGSGPRPLARLLLTRSEAELFDPFDPAEIYKNVSGLNPIQLRRAMRYLRGRWPEGRRRARDLYQEIRVFKSQQGASLEIPTVRWEEIGGHEEAKAELRDALRLVSAGADLPESIRGRLVPRGFLLHGPPGTGKTLFAKAIAHQLNATVVAISGPEVMDMYVGESERRIRDAFQLARRNAPSVILFDEFDSIAHRRSGGGDGGARAGNAVVAQLLTEMDGLRGDQAVLVIATTNRVDIVDPALLRPSRFKAVEIGLPDPEARRAICGIHARSFGVPASEDALRALAAATEGFSGDEIQAVFREVRREELTRGIPMSDERLHTQVARMLDQRIQRTRRHLGG